MYKRQKVGVIVILLLYALLSAQQIGHSESTYESSTMESWIEIFFISNELPTENYKLTNIEISENYFLYVFSFKEINEKGYILTFSNGDKIEIIEYGFGRNIPYVKETIVSEDIKTLEPTSFTYISPFESFWEFEYIDEKVYIDGVTGEWLVDLFRFKEGREIFKFSSTSNKIKQAYLDKELVFNPFDDISWLVEPIEVKGLSEKELIKALYMKEKIIYIGAKYNKFVNFAFPIIGYHNLENNLYLAIYDEYFDLIRYIPQDVVNHYGQSYLLK